MKKTEKNINRPNLYDYLKVLALICMVFDHVWYYFFPEYQRLRLIWRLAFPIFLFLVWFNWSYHWRRDIPLWGIFLWLIMMISELILWIWIDVTLNILIWITLARLIVRLIDKIDKAWFTITISVLFILLHPLLVWILEYWSLCFFFALWGWIARKYPSYFWLWIFFLFACIVHSITIFDFWYSTENYFYPVVLCFLFSFLYYLFFFLSKKNIPIRFHNLWDSIILWFSKHTLAFYWIHIIILFFLSLTINWFLF